MSYKFKRDYGDGYETDDSVLWIDGEPTEYCVSPVSSCCYAAMEGYSTIGYYDTRKEAQEVIKEELGL